ncbi:MAG: pantoate--beta-alanine ligase, partial [Micavibrio aeruginosavorus]
MIRLHNFEELQAYAGAEDSVLGLVPTMGALHEGHLHLAQIALADSDRVIVTIFVNPKQFAPHEDLAKYPRTLEADMEKLAAIGVHAVYTPSVDDMYPEGFATKISVSKISEPMEGQFRPQFFDGVATIVAKLFLQVMPDKAFFGEKDYQQLQVIKRMVTDLNLPIEIVPVPTVRDKDSGLALSSRNAYLSEDELKIAQQLNLVLLTMAEKIDSGFDTREIESWGI